MIPLKASQCTIGDDELPMTMQVGMVGVDGLVIAGDTRQFIERSGKSWYSYNSTKFRVSDSGRIAIACARNMDISLKVADAVFSELPTVAIENRASRIDEIGRRIAAGFDSECIVAFVDPSPALYAFLCDKSGNGRCMEVDRVPTGDAGNPAYFWAERYYSKSLNVKQLTRLSAHIIISAGTMNNGSIEGLEVLTLENGNFRLWSKDENATLAMAAAQDDNRFGEIVINR